MGLWAWAKPRSLPASFSTVSCRAWDGLVLPSNSSNCCSKGEINATWRGHNPRAPGGGGGKLAVIFAPGAFVSLASLKNSTGSKTLRESLGHCKSWGEGVVHRCFCNRTGERGGFKKLTRGRYGTLKDTGSSQPPLQASPCLRTAPKRYQNFWVLSGCILEPF